LASRSSREKAVDIIAGIVIVGGFTYMFGWVIKRIWDLRPRKDRR
jgi:hypothetical protein